MAPFPVELWHNVLNNLSEQESIAVANTCRTFRSIVRPRFNDELYVELDESNQPTSEEAACALRVMRWVLHAGDRELADFVDIFTVEVRSFWGRPIDYPSLPEEIRHGLPLFVNLHSLCLGLINIDHGFCDLVAVLPHLTNVSYVSCDIAPSLIKDTEATLDDSGITNVTIADPSAGHGWSRVMSSNARFLDINCVQREADDIVFSIFDELMDFDQTESLEVFTLRSSPFPSNLVDFLGSCHQLRRIELDKIPIALVGSFDNLPEDALTHLECFTGHVEDAGLFTKGRPIHTAELISKSKIPVDALKALGHSTGPITNLKLRARDLTPEHLQYAPPTLRELHLERVCDTSWLSAFSRFPDIEILRMSDFQISRDRQAAFVHDASVVCVSLREIVFNVSQAGKRETYKWCRRSDGPWELDTD